MCGVVLRERTLEIQDRRACAGQVCGTKRVRLGLLARRGEIWGGLVGGLEWRGVAWRCVGGKDRMGWDVVAVGRVRLASTRDGGQGVWARLVGV